MGKRFGGIARCWHKFSSKVCEMCIEVLRWMRFLSVSYSAVLQKSDACVSGQVRYLGHIGEAVAGY